MVNNIRNNAISEISAEKGLNFSGLKTLNEIKNANIIKYSTNTIFTDKTLKSKSQKDNTLMSSKDKMKMKMEMKMITT